MREMARTATGPEAGFSSARSGSDQAGQIRLGRARCGMCGTIVGIAPDPVRAVDAIDNAELERRLLEMGFVEGARVQILHEGPIGRDPIVVKVDDTRVALRRCDADALLIVSDADSCAA